MQRVQKDTLAQVDKGCILRIFPDKLEGSKTSLILKDTKTEASCRTIFMTAAAGRAEAVAGTAEAGRNPRPGAVPQQRDAAAAAQRSGGGAGAHPQEVPEMAGRTPGVSPHRLSRSAAFQCHLPVMISGGDIKAVQGTTGHASADMLVNTYAHIQQSSRVELGKKFESGFYAKPDTSSPQAVPAAGEPTISMTALLELLKDATRK